MIFEEKPLLNLIVSLIKFAGYNNLDTFSSLYAPELSTINGIVSY